MTLPLAPTAHGRRPAYRCCGAALVVLLLLAVGLRAARAEDADPFTTTVPIDATAETVGKAREAARVAGQRRALAAVAERLAGAGAPAKLAKLDDNTVTDLVASFEVANERMSAVRYLADYTFHFRPAEVRRVLGNAGLAVGEAPGKPVVVLPVYEAAGQTTLWDDPNPWRQAFSQQSGGSGATQTIIPLGDAGDIAAIDADKARAGNPGALAAIGQRNDAGETVVALAKVSGPPGKPTGVEVTARRYRGGKLVDSHAEPIAANPGESEPDLLRRAAGITRAGLSSGWKKEPPAGYDQQGSLTAVLPISGLEDWVRARDRLAGLPTIRKVALIALSVQEATIEIAYVGNVDQLKASLAKISLDLVRDEPLWRLARTGPGGSF